ncbi:MAG: hypothetical protein OXE57_16685 [Alphaproteobacteria bacterium]|nr:hypothetical protein [Alphaproteobacteria bacterium]
MDAIKDTLKPWLVPAVIVAVFGLGLAPVYVMLGSIERKIGSARTELGTRIDKTRDELKGDIRALSERLDKTRTELKGEINMVRTDLKGDIQTLSERLDKTRTELKGEINMVRTDLKAEIHSLGTRLDSTRDGLDRRMEATTARVDALAIRVDAVERGDAPKGAQGSGTPDPVAPPQ